MSHETRVKAFIKTREGMITDRLKGAVSEGVYTFGELGLFCDAIDNMSVEQAVQVWALVESIRQKGEFPDDLRM